MNYYETLGVRQTAGSTEIKRAFRKLAVTYHPDKNPDPQAEEIFKQINEAYDVLSDPVKKNAYDLRLSNPFREVVPPQPKHRDPAYHPGRQKTYRKSQKQSIRELMQQYLPYTQALSVICFVIALVFLVDYVWPQKITDQNIVSVATRRTYSRNSVTTWWVVNTSNGNSIDIPFLYSDYYFKGEPIRVHASYFLRIPRKAEVKQHSQSIRNTIYGNFIFVPAALLILSSLGVVLRKNVDYGFNLGVSSFVVLLFFIVFLLIL